MPAIRTSIGKSKRFTVFSRDNFTCRYCGRQSDVVPLEVDHVIPVCKGGTADLDNLITACFDCNRGKAGRLPTHTAPTEEDRLRLAQERNEQRQAAESARMAAKAREDYKQVIINYWCSVTGRDSVESGTLTVILSYAKRHGHDLIFEWIDKAGAICPYSDSKMGRYISGIRRSYEEENK